MNNSSHVVEEISKLSDSELSDRLVDFGFSRTPVTIMTRKYLEKQLVTKINQIEGRKQNDENNENPINGMNWSENTLVYSPEKENQINSNNTSAEAATTFYAVFCPSDSSEIDLRVFYEQEDALKYAKKNKRSRFKSFKSYDEAVNFATHGVNVNGSVTSPIMNQPPMPANNVDGASRFKGPKSQDLVLLRKAIESGNVGQVRRMVWENPRYLVSSGDTPSILQEGARYNALHIAAKVLNAEMTSFLLETVSDMKFIQLLYGVESEENCRQRAMFLLDLYLNTPDKSLNETPLHLAVKFGAVSVVQVLVSYPECDKCRLNKHSHTPQEIICSRINNPQASIVTEIEQLLRDAFFVPVLRSMASVLQPTVGEPFSSKKPLVANNDPLSPHMDVTAYAGPMDYEQAQTFRRRWKTPPRVVTSMALRVARLNDFDRGLEREGRDLAKQHNIRWKEYWPFLGIFTDFCTREGISKLEEYLKDKFEKMSTELASVVMSEREPPTTPPKQISSILSANGSSSQALSPMSELCVALTTCSLADKNSPSTPPPRPLVQAAKTTTQQDSATSLSPIMYIEKTCQVLARRLAEGIFNALQASEDYTYLSKTLKDVLHTEVSNMQKCIVSFKANTYFSNLNFQLIHSRIAMLIPYYLDDSTQSYDLMLICSSLQTLASHPNDKSSDEDDEAVNYRQLARAAPLLLGEQVSCLAQLVIQALNRPGGSSLGLADLEADVLELWGRGSECSCTWSASPPMPRSMRRGASLKRGLSRQAPPSGRVWTRDEAEQVVQRMPSVEMDDEQSETSESEESKIIGDSLSVEDETENFYTPPSSVTSDAADLEEFDCPDEGTLVFLDGKVPTKLDVDVLRALDIEQLTAEQFPNIWRWRHQVMQYTEQERECWPSPAHIRHSSSSSGSLSPVAQALPSPRHSPLAVRKPSGLQQMWGSPEPPFSSPPKRRLNL